MTRGAALIWATTPYRDRLALHEAAHAVAAADLDLRVDFVSTEVDRRDNFSSWGRMMPGYDRAPVYLQIVVLLAGGEAERRQFGFAELDASDIADARGILARTLGVGPADPPVTAQLAELRTLTAKALDDEGIWPWILATASALKKRRTLTGADVLQLRPQTTKEP